MHVSQLLHSVPSWMTEHTQAQSPLFRAAARGLRLWTASPPHQKMQLAWSWCPQSRHSPSQRDQPPSAATQRPVLVPRLFGWMPLQRLLQGACLHPSSHPTGLANSPTLLQDVLHSKYQSQPFHSIPSWMIEHSQAQLLSTQAAAQGLKSWIASHLH